MRGIIVSYRVNGRECRGPVLDVVYLPVAAASGVLQLPGKSAGAPVPAGMLSMVLLPVRLEDGKLGAAWFPLGDVRIAGVVHEDKAGSASVEVWHGDGTVWGGA